MLPLYMFQSPERHRHEGNRPVQTTTGTATLLYQYCFVYNLPCVLVEAETCRRDFINDKSLFIFDRENC